MCTSLLFITSAEEHCVKSVQIRSFFWSVFSCIQTQYRDLRSKSPYSVRIQENADQKKLSIWTLFTQWNIYYYFCFIGWPNQFFYAFVRWLCWNNCVAVVFPSPVRLCLQTSFPLSWRREIPESNGPSLRTSKAIKVQYYSIVNMSVDPDRIWIKMYLIH